jgi:hypothetical protein
MITVAGTYEDGQIKLDRTVDLDHPSKVIVTFLDEEETETPKTRNINDFGFAKGREILKDLKSSLSDSVIEE